MISLLKSRRISINQGIQARHRIRAQRRMFAGFIHTVLRLFAFSVLVCFGAFAQAQSYPEHSLQLVLSFPPGGATDVLARALAEDLGKELKQTVVVLNRPGAGGTIGMRAAARAKPDGYTLYIASVMSNVIYEVVNNDEQISLDRDFDAVGGVASAAHVLIVPAKSGIKDMKRLVSYLKEKPGHYNYASNGVGTLNYLEGEIFKNEMGVDVVHIPYKGSAQSMPELLSGSIAFMFDSVATTLPQKEGRTINALAVSANKRVSVMPDVPTFKELGINNLTLENVFSVMVPKGTPSDRIEVLASALRKVQQKPAFGKSVGTYGFEVSEIPGPELMQAIVDLKAFWRTTFKRINAK